MAVERSTSVIRGLNLHAVLEALTSRDRMSRSELAQRTGLSKPTIGAALRDFTDRGLVRRTGQTAGHRGPSAGLYQLAPDGMLVLAVDVGSRYVRARLADALGDEIASSTVALERPDAKAAVAALRQVRDHLTTEQADVVALAVVGSPGIIDPVTGRIGAAPNIEGWEGLLADQVIGDALAFPVRVENDVNLAALGEQAVGDAAGVGSFAYLSIGAGLGAGVVLDGRLHRGASGAAGEVAFLPVDPETPSRDRPPHSGAMERRLSSAAVSAHAARLAPTHPSAVSAPFDPSALFAAARRGDPLGRAVAHHVAHEIAVCATGLDAVLDLELIILGGGIGANGDLLLDGALDALAGLCPSPPTLRVSRLGDGAVLAGAVAVGVTVARAQVVTEVTAIVAT